MLQLQNYTGYNQKKCYGKSTKRNIIKIINTAKSANRIGNFLANMGR